MSRPITGQKPKTQRTCIICDGYGPALCRACQRDYDKATKTDDGTIMATIRWAAERASAKERERSKKITDMALKRFGAAVMVKDALDALIEAKLGEKMGRLDAAFAAVRMFEERKK
jgi:hypothetical protein